MEHTDTDSPAPERDFLFMPRIKMTFEYDGTDFVGWQIQDNGRSVQGIVEQALSELLQEHIRIVGAGRTDAGVHARGQVAHFESETSIEVQAILRGLNALLPEDVSARKAELVPEEFHARYSARARTYRYTISQERMSLGRRYMWFVGHPLNEGLMNACSKKIAGEHDFQAFCKVASDVKHYRCTVASADWTRSGSTLIFAITANRFLYGMVRALVGTMVEIGRGYRPLEDFLRILESGDRKQAGMAAPAHALVLEEVLYEVKGGDDVS